jgi:hypothetical protein
MTMRYERCFNAAIKALERLDSVRYMWNGPIIQAVVFLREATGPQPDAAPDAGATSGREVPAAAPVAAPLPEEKQIGEWLWWGRAEMLPDGPPVKPGTKLYAFDTRGTWTFNLPPLPQGEPRK